MTSTLSRFKRHFGIWVLIPVLLLVGLESGLGLPSVTLTIPSQGSIRYEATEASALYVDGRHIRRVSDDSIIYLRGVHMWGPWEDDPRGKWMDIDGDWHWETWDIDIINDNFAAMTDWGMNCIRLHFSAQFWLDDTDGFRQRVKDMLTIADSYGFYVVLDLYNTFAWEDQPPLPWIHDWGNSPIQDAQDFVDLWISIANELKTYPNVVFDLFNEPHQAYGYTYQECKDMMFDAFQDCITEIRKITDHIITVAWWWGVEVDMNNPEGYCDDMSWVEDERLQGDNIIYQTHIYEDSYGFYGGGVYGQTKEEIEAAFTYEKVDIGTLYGKVLFVGEWGRDQGDAGASECFKNSGELLHEYGVHYTAFSWRNTVGSYAEYRLLLPGYNYPPSGNGEALQDLLAGP